MNRIFYYEITTPHGRYRRCYKLADFHLIYLIARKMSSLAIKFNGSLVVRKLTLWVAIKYRVKSIFGV